MTADAQLRLVIAEEHGATRAGVRLTLEPHGFVVVEEAADRTAAVEAAARERPDLCLLDADLPGGAIAAAAEIAAVAPTTAVVMLGASADDEAVLGALRAGAQGYLLKNMDATRLPHALRGVVAGEAALPRTLVTRLIEEIRSGRRRHSHALEQLGVELTGREWDVLELMREDLPTSTIAERLAISPVTVRRHVSELLRKLDVPTRSAAVALINADAVQD